MHNPLGFSVYTSTFEKQLPMLKTINRKNTLVFTSLHIAEEVDDDYVNKTKEMCHWLYQNDFNIIADVSPKTLAIFEQKDILSLVKDLHISVLRLDYGFNEREITQLAKKIPIAFNASTLDVSVPLPLEGKLLYAMHNFYPRPETGLDEKLFETKNQAIKQKGSVQIIAFIPGDQALRGPIYEGLPTLEKHRGWPPYLAYLDLITKSLVDQVFLSDVQISSEQLKLIEDYQSDEIISVPVSFTDNYDYLYNQVYTIRIDSPHGLIRLQESRGYASQGEKIISEHCSERFRGKITIDNEKYKRYSGEIQIMRENYPKDERVNVVGEINEMYLPIVDCIKNGDSIRFVPF
ncbi:MupG family TIM beta-alpha barrel fold protein [Virgibacillus sp. Bac332]|nr:MupG family TIM beta-alpha barrel fold protein [Virgibacillus sp. Bac332]